MQIAQACRTSLPDAIQEGGPVRQQEHGRAHNNKGVPHQSPRCSSGRRSGRAVGTWTCARPHAPGTCVSAPAWSCTPHSLPPCESTRAGCCMGRVLWPGNLSLSFGHLATGQAGALKHSSAEVQRCPVASRHPSPCRRMASRCWPELKALPLSNEPLVRDTTPAAWQGCHVVPDRQAQAPLARPA